MCGLARRGCICPGILYVLLRRPQKYDTFKMTAEYRQWQKEGREFKIGAIVDADE